MDIIDKLQHKEEATKSDIIQYKTEFYYQHTSGICYADNTAYYGGDNIATAAEPRKKAGHKKTEEYLEHLVIRFAVEHPDVGQKTAADELARKGKSIAASTINRIWQKHNLETFEKRVKALEKEMSLGKLPTEEQKQALRKNADNNVKTGTVETHYPGYLGSQDTYCPGYFKSLGKVYQQTYIDTFSKLVFVKLYHDRSQQATADMINSTVFPFFANHQTSISQILTDRGIEYCGSRDRHLYQQSLYARKITHTKARTKNPQVNGICDNFHRVMQTDFYTWDIWDKPFNTLEELQMLVDRWVASYNKERKIDEGVHIGRTPYEVFQQHKHISLPTISRHFN